MAWPTFWVERMDQAVVSLRRYVSGDEEKCPGPKGYHDASTAVGRLPLRVTEDDAYEAIPVEEYADGQRWPKKCGACDYRFADGDQRQVNQEPVYRDRLGREWTAPDLPAGAMFEAKWYGAFGVGPDGIALVVVLPGSSPDARTRMWHVDGPARNHEGGTKPNAWTRTGDPRSDPPTVDVNPSIQTGDYHGYLRNGVLTDPV